EQRSFTNEPLFHRALLPAASQPKKMHEVWGTFDTQTVDQLAASRVIDLFPTGEVWWRNTLTAGSLNEVVQRNFGSTGGILAVPASVVVGEQQRPFGKNLSQARKPLHSLFPAFRKEFVRQAGGADRVYALPDSRRNRIRNAAAIPREDSYPTSGARGGNPLASSGAHPRIHVEPPSHEFTFTQGDIRQ